MGRRNRGFRTHSHPTDFSLSLTAHTSDTHLKIVALHCPSLLSHSLSLGVENRQNSGNSGGTDSGCDSERGLGWAVGVAVTGDSACV